MVPAVAAAAAAAAAARAAHEDDRRSRLVAAAARMVVAAGTVAAGAQPHRRVRVVRLPLRLAVFERRVHFASDRERDVARFRPFLVHGPSQALHRFRVRPVGTTLRH